jgi:hypothetical protein
MIKTILSPHFSTIGTTTMAEKEYIHKFVTSWYYSSMNMGWATPVLFLPIPDLLQQITKLL